MNVTQTPDPSMHEPVAVLLIFVNEADLWYDVPLYEAIVERVRELGIAGATAQPGLIGFGHHHLAHQHGVLGVATDRPVTITVVDEERKIRAILPDIRSFVHEGLVLLLHAELVTFGAPG